MREQFPGNDPNFSLQPEVWQANVHQGEVPLDVSMSPEEVEQALGISGHSCLGAIEFPPEPDQQAPPRFYILRQESRHELRIRSQLRAQLFGAQDVLIDRPRAQGTVSIVPAQALELATAQRQAGTRISQSDPLFPEAERLSESQVGVWPGHSVNIGRHEAFGQLLAGRGMVSRSHVSVSMGQDGRAFLQDHSSNGTRLLTSPNELALPAMQPPARANAAETNQAQTAVHALGANQEVIVRDAIDQLMPNVQRLAEIRMPVRLPSGGFGWEPLYVVGTLGNPAVQTAAEAYEPQPDFEMQDWSEPFVTVLNRAGLEALQRLATTPYGFNQAARRVWSQDAEMVRQNMHQLRRGEEVTLGYDDIAQQAPQHQQRYTSRSHVRVAVDENSAVHILGLGRNPAEVVARASAADQPIR